MTRQTGHIDGYTRLVGLIGRPARPWLSWSIYNAAFDALQLNWRYVPLPVPEGRWREALLGLGALGFAGAEVIGPHQREMADHLEELSPAAETIGAVNFIRVDEHGASVGDNTRWLSFLAGLRAMVPSLNGLRPLVIGAGATARAIVYALTREGLPVIIVNEHIDQAIDLVHRLRHVLDEHSFSVYRWPHDLARAVANANLVVNTTCAETWPDEQGSCGSSPWPDDLPFPPGVVVFDMVYRPGETRFLSQARLGGARTAGGLHLLVYEAALAFERWTGRTPPIEVMFQASGQPLTDGALWDTLWLKDMLATAG